MVTKQVQHSDFLPLSRQEAQERGWSELDFIIVSADAYVDHASFGTAIIGRLLESQGYRVGIIAQPNWRTDQDFLELGTPRLAFLVAGGNIDSMVSHYTAAIKRRRDDAYSPGGQAGLRPDRATIVYANKLRSLFKQTPIILGGLEASLRRFGHYDYWSDKVRRAIILDANADLVVYGMGELAILEIADALAAGIGVEYLNYIRGTVYRTSEPPNDADALYLPHYNGITADKKQFAHSFAQQYQNTDPISGQVLVEQYDECYVAQNPPARSLTSDELDSIYRLPFTRQYHPSYEAQGGIPALEEVKFSLLSSRGCFGDCSFCAITFHQGRTIQARSIDAIVEEAQELTEDPEFKGYIHDVGGPTANFRVRACKHQVKHGVCRNRQCLFPKPCRQLQPDHSEYLSLLQKLRQLPGVKKVFIRSGIRYDYLLADSNSKCFQDIVKHHVSGQLRVAPEHVSAQVLHYMKKPGVEVYEEFSRQFYYLTKKAGKEQYLVPYFMSSHPGSTLHDAIELAEFIRDMGFNPEQVQDFYPTPGTLATCMFYTGLEPLTMKPVFVAKTKREKAMQRALIQYRNPRNYSLVLAALTEAKRTDLIGDGPHCLIRPPQQHHQIKQRKKGPRRRGRSRQKLK